MVDAQTETVHGLSLGRCLQWSAALLSVAAAAIHFGAMGEHAGVSWSHGLFFAGAAWCELVFAAWILWRPTSRAAWFGIALNAGVLAVWVVSRTVGIPIGSDGEPETVGFIDTLASFIEVATIVACVGLLSPSVATARIGRVVGIGGVAVVGAVSIVLATAAFTPSFAASDGHDHGATAAGDHGDGHDHGAAVGADDRGFAALANGEQHDHAFTLPLTERERVELGRQLALARETALRYPTVADAEAAGLRRAGPFAPGLGAHYINFGNASGPPDGVMTDEWIGRPLAWMYDGTKPTSRIAGLFYGSAVKDPEGFAGPNDVWHAHRNACVVQTPTGIDAPLGADQPVTERQCDAVGGTLIRQTQQLLHVWVVPGYESPEGVYAHLSSAVTCDDGTYRVIPDITKVGKRTSICRSGTE
ncbi:MAG: hypothetical protein ACKO72_05675 [Actinomycetes bacterium]